MNVINRKIVVLICTTLFLTSQGVSYGHNVNPPDHNHPPTFGSIATDVYISENLSNYSIGSVTATDPDEGDTLTYSIASDINFYSDPNSGDPQSYSHLFTINSETGELRTSGALDFEALPFTYHPTHVYLPAWIRVEDNEGASAVFAYQLLIADENDNAPVFSEDSQTLSINENQPSGTTVGTVSASDAMHSRGIIPTVLRLRTYRLRLRAVSGAEP